MRKDQGHAGCNTRDWPPHAHHHRVCRRDSPPASIRPQGSAATPLSGATVENWQCDAHGRYLHPADTGKRPRDSAFQGYGRMTSGADGAYRFRTIRPVAYPGRTPHIHFAVSPPGRRQLITQMYVAGEPQNQSDSLYTSIHDGRQRAAVTVALTP